MQLLLNLFPRSKRYLAFSLPLLFTLFFLSPSNLVPFQGPEAELCDYSTMFFLSYLLTYLLSYLLNPHGMCRWVLNGWMDGRTEKKGGGMGRMFTLFPFFLSFD